MENTEFTKEEMQMDRVFFLMFHFSSNQGQVLKTMK